MIEPITKIIPILLLIALGNYMRHRNWLNDEFTNKLKLGIINIALPSVLFLTFKNMELEAKYLIISIISLFMLIVFYLVGIFIKNILHLKSVVLPFFASGFAFGLLGIPLFEGVYGIENLGDLTILGIGNEFFVWFIYLTLIKQKFGGTSFSSKTILNFLTSPLIISIIAGLSINLLGFSYLFDDFVLLKGINLTLDYLASMSTPLILIIIGYGIKINTHYLKRSLQFVLFRLIIVLSIGYLVKIFIINNILGETSDNFNLAYFTFLILPPPFTLPIFVGQYCNEDDTIITNNAVVISTIISIILFVAMVLFSS